MLAENPETGGQEYKRVANTYIHEKDVIVHVCVGDEEIETTKEHPFYVEDVGFVMAGSLKEGDILRLADGRTVEVSGIETEHLSEPVYVYNFEVEDYHTYFVSELGVLVHNNCGPGTGNKGGTYTPPAGGGGTTATIHANGKTVNFGHGGRHLEGMGLDVNRVNQTLANEVSKLNLSKGEFYKGQIVVDGITIKFTSYGLGNDAINVGTYYPINN